MPQKNRRLEHNHDLQTFSLSCAKTRVHKSASLRRRARQLPQASFQISSETNLADTKLGPFGWFAERSVKTTERTERQLAGWLFGWFAVQPGWSAELFGWFAERLVGTVTGFDH